MTRLHRFAIGALMSQANKETPMTLQVTIRNVYGTEKIYPANDAAYTFAQIAGTVTLTRDTLGLVKRLGYTIEVLPAEIYTL